MNYSGIIWHDSANGPGWRTTLFVSGCQHHCEGCQNAEAQDYTMGEPFNEKIYNKIMEFVKKPEVQGLTISGGDPLWQTEQDIQTLTSLCQEVHSIGKDVWLWTGFAWEEIFDESLNGTDIETLRELIKNCDIVVDGRFDNSKKDLSLKWRGSLNQRIINVQKTLKSHGIVEEL